MKYLIISVLILLSTQKISGETININVVQKIEEITIIAPANKWKTLIADVYYIESSNGLNLYGDNGKAIGPLQMWEVMVDDVNRILGFDKFTYNDRMNFDKSIAMFIIIQKHYNPDTDYELALRIWNAGPKAKDRSNDYMTDDYVSKSKFLNEIS